MVQESKEAIVAVQTLRNSVTGVAILAASDAALASALLQIITDPTKIDQVVGAQYVHDAVFTVQTATVDEVSPGLHCG